MGETSLIDIYIYTFIVYIYIYSLYKALKKPKKSHNVMMWLDGPEVIHDGPRRCEGDLLVEGNVSLHLANDPPSTITRLLPSKFAR